MSWEETRELILDREDYECRFCGTGDEEHREEHGSGLEVHHVLPKSSGGSNSPKNLVALCGSCHRTMETIHARAVEDLNGPDYSGDAERFHMIWRQFERKLDRYEDRLWSFVDSHPVFTSKFTIYNEGYRDGQPRVASRELQEKANTLEGEITSEWAFVAQFGYIQGVMDVTTEMDGQTDVPYDEFDDKQ